MDITTIAYGGFSLTLTKSQTLIAAKPATMNERRMDSVFTRRMATSARLQLGGFAVAEVDDASKMESTLDAVRNDDRVDVGSHVFHTSEDGVPFVPTGQVFVRFAKDAATKACQALIEQHSLIVLETPGPDEVLLQVTADSSNPIKVVAALQQSKLVAIAEPELATQAKRAAFTLPSDSLVARQWHLKNTGTIDGSPLGLKSGADARVVAAWEKLQSVGSRDVIVAVIDDGFDLDHPDLSGPGKIAAPWDFTRSSDDPRPEFRTDYPSFDPTQQEWVGDWHGTACAGVAVGNADGTGIVGVAPACQLMPVRWGPSLTDSQIEAWFSHVSTRGAAVVSCSWSAAAKNFPLSTRQIVAIQRCARDGRNGLGCVICFAAGNENRDINDPAHGSVNGFATHPDVIAVAASNSVDKRSNYSNFGAAISVCAPSSGAGGRGVVTADVTGTFLRNGQRIESGYSPGAYTNTFGGTSSATPLVAGACALLLSQNPELTAAQVKALIQDTARKIGPASSYDASGHSNQFGSGCINTLAAVESILASQPIPARPARSRGTSAARRGRS